MHNRKTTAARLTASLLLVSALVIPALAATGTVNSGNSPLRVRAQASADSQVLTKLSDGTQVDVISGLQDGWYQIAFGDLTGYVSGDYLIVSEAPAVPSSTVVSAVSAPAPFSASRSACPAAQIAEVVQDAVSSMEATVEDAVETYEEPLYAKVTVSSLNIRSGPGTTHDKVGSLRIGKIVDVLGRAGDWYKIESGYISAEYVVLVDAETAAAASLGQEIADYALQFLGYPYVYGGSSTRGFDCSGFTKYVYAQFGYSINRTASNQLDNGVSVSMSELEPGDLVFFKKSGTGSKRASHVGIYIGNSQFVHASTSKVGVIVSHMSDAYYTTGFVGGRRLV